MPDGTLKQINPLTGRRAWSVPGRGRRPTAGATQAEAKKLRKRDPEDYCNFCEASYLQTPPEKARFIRSSGKYRSVDRIDADRLFQSRAEFRRVPNLFEILTFDYWAKNYEYRLSEKNARWKERYLATESGRAHVNALVDLKLKLSGLKEEEVRSTAMSEKLLKADAFFGGSHELIIARRHYGEEARYESDLFAPGGLTQEQHYQYFRFTIQAIQDIYSENRYVRYVAAFQNWLRAAGATFDHLHKQLVGLDEWGVAIEREVNNVTKNPHIYNQLVVNYAQYTNRVIAENEHATAFADIGHRFPTVAVYSKSRNLRPYEHTDAEMRGFSDIVHAVHVALGPGISCNEEWYYRPVDCLDKLPWHIFIKLRISTPAGFEGGTRLHINPISPYELRDMVVEKLYPARDKKIIDGFKIAEECPCEPNCLRYEA
jgi:galactose-1-phosphate uridylyltransferase